MPTLSANSYGKSAVRLSKLVRDGARHELLEYVVDLLLTGDFDRVYTEGDNSPCVPTDTMKNTVYALAKQHDFAAPETFATILASHFIETFPHVASASIRIEQGLWQRIAADGRPHDHAFVRASGVRTAAALHTRGSALLSGGLTGLEVVKTTRSGFTGFHKDRYTTLRETTERIMGTSITATWRFASPAPDFNAAFAAVRDTLLRVFAGHDSRGVQHTLYEMGRQVLAAAPDLAEISLSLPNQHRILANLAPFNLANDNEIFVATEEPYGVIQGTVSR